MIESGPIGELPWPTVEVEERIGRASATLTPAERRVAEVVLERPQLVAFGTVAELAEAAGSGAATVVRQAA
jgi:DNA-binding MurR/RpiR family transcriptional regulator